MDKKNLRILLQEEELLETEAIDKDTYDSLPRLERTIVKNTYHKYKETDLTTEEMQLIVSIKTLRDIRTIKTILLINLMIACVGILYFLLN